VGVGGGIGILTADVNAKASRKDTVGECGLLVDDVIGCDPLSGKLDLEKINQHYDSKFNDLSGTGGFVTMQGAYDYQFAPRWVVGAFVDADWSDISADASRQSTGSSLSSLAQAWDQLVQPTFTAGNAMIDTKISTDWNVSVGGRIGWLATPRMLLYFLAAYTHAELGDAHVNVHIADPVNFVDGGGYGIDHGLSLETPIDQSLLVRLPDSLDGFSLGGGTETKLRGPWSVKFEYRWTHLEGGSGHASRNQELCCIERYTDEEILPDVQAESVGIFHDAGSQASASFDANIQTVRGDLVYHFWSGGGGYGS
jgi:outer membrane immunogenic protein